jgi:hypothetical protein
LARLASAHDPRHGRRSLSRQIGRRPQAIGFRQSKRKESDERSSRLNRIKSLIPSVQEIRALLARLLLPRDLARPFVFAWSLWRRHNRASAAVADYKRNKLQTRL